MAKGKKKRTEQQVAAWLYAVVAPVVNGLTQEDYFLSVQKAPTWRFRPRKCEFLHRIPEYVDVSQHPTLAQFRRYNPAEAKLADKHDAGLNGLEAAATAAHAGLLALPAFRALVQRVEGEVSDWRGAYGPQDAANLFAQDVINWAHTPEPPDHYTDAKAWKRFGPEALALREDQAVTPAFARLDEAHAALAVTTRRLKKRLEELRDELSDAFGLPPAPVTLSSPPGSFESFESF